MNVPKLRFKEFNDEWKKIKLSDISNITMGQSPDSNNYTTNKNDMILIQGNADLNNGIVLPRIFTTQVTKQCYIGDIIMTVRAPVGDVAISNYNACIGRGVCAIKGSKFIYHYLKYLKGKEYWKKISKGSTIDSITSNDIKELEIKIPLASEENKIIKFMDLLDKKIELQSKKIEALKLYKKGLLKKQYCYIKNINNIEISQFAQVYQPITLSTATLKGGKYSVFGANGIIGYHNEYNHEFEQVTISCRGENSGKINFTPKKCWINGNSMVINIDNSSKITKEYLYYILSSQNLNYLISGSGQPQITRDVVLKHKIPLIEYKQQLNYTKIFKHFDIKIKIEEQKLSKLESLKKGLMQIMFV